MTKYFVRPLPNNRLVIGDAQRGGIKSPKRPIRPPPQCKTTKHNANPGPTDGGAFAQRANLKGIQRGSGDQGKDGNDERLANQSRTAPIKLPGLETFGFLPLSYSSLHDQETTDQEISDNSWKHRYLPPFFIEQAS